MKPIVLAASLSFLALAIVVPAIITAVRGGGYGGLVIALPVVPVIALILWKLVPWAFREDDAHLMQLLHLFECTDVVHELRKIGVKTTTDLEFITPERLNGLSASIVTKSKLEDALRHCGARGWAKQVYIKSDESPNAPCKTCNKPEGDHHGKQKHCSKRCADAIEKLLRKQTPQLFTACRRGDDEAIVRLITAGADVNVEDDHGRTPLHCACHNGQDAAVRSLISSGAKVNARDRKGTTSMQYACISGSKECVRLLLKAGVSAKEHFGELRTTAVHLAASKRKTAVCELLLLEGADVNARDIHGSTPLHEGELGSADAKLLLKYKADLMAKDANARTPLHKAAYVGTRTVVVTLLEAKALVDAKDSEGCTALHWAAKMGHVEVVQALIEEGKANINLTNIDGESALHFAEDVKVGEALLAQGGDPQLRDLEGKTPLDVAVSSRNKGVIDLLRPLVASSKKQE